MDIPVIQDNEIENEFSLNLCCSACVIDNYGWTIQQYELIKKRATDGQPTDVPDYVETATQFIEFVKKNIKASTEK